MEHRKAKIKNCKTRLNAFGNALNRTGSALVLVVVLTVLLASVGVMFLMMARISEMGTAGIGDDLQLRQGVNTVVDRIRDVLIDDLLGNDPNLLNNDNSDEYWDYPGADDPWLASLEPMSDGTNYVWPHVTDLYDDNYGLDDLPPLPAGEFYHDPDDDGDSNQWKTGSGYEVSADNVIARILRPDERVSVVAEDGNWTDDVVYMGARADADGDGVADSRWMQLPNISGTRGEPIYAAVRITDNSAMIDINTAYRDPTGEGDWDGSQLSHVNLDGIRATTEVHTIYDLHALRYDGDPAFPVPDDIYHDQVASRLLNPVPGYLPFDLSDELELRNRNFLSTSYRKPGVSMRCALAWPITFNPQADPGRGLPFGSRASDTLALWYDKVKPDIDDGNGSDIGDYNRRFLSTTLNLDRTIAPSADTTGMPQELQDAWNIWKNWNDPDPDNWTYRPISVNDYDPTDPNSFSLIAAAIWLGLPANNIAAAMPQFTGLGWTGAQMRERAAYMMAVNLVDYIDADNTVTSHKVGTTTYYGYESAGEQLYITKIAVAQYYDDTVNPAVSSTHYAIEVYNPSDNPITLSNWELKKNNGASIALPGNTILARTSGVIADDITFPAGFSTSSSISVPSVTFAVGDTIELILKQASGNVVFDWISVPSDPLAASSTELRNHDGSSTPPLEIYYADRKSGATDNRLSVSSPASEATMPILPEILTWESTPAATLPDYSFGGVFNGNDIVNPPIQLEVPDAELKTIGEFTNVLAMGMMGIDTDSDGDIDLHYNMPEFWDNIRNSLPGLVAANLAAGRIDLQDNNFANIFKYLTIFNLAGDGIDNDGIDGPDDPAEVAVAGRVNINTAPWFVLAQLPWMQHSLTLNWYDRARAIYYDRDTNGAFENISGIMRVPEMGSLAFDTDANSDLTGPDFIPDGFTDDLEERDLIFQRISNLVTVRSDLFTAYILVRLDVDGPQKRMIAIFDRSRVFSRNDRVRLIALHPVPDSR